MLGSGARAYGMGGAFLARADDATAASWNPAGLSYLRSPEISLVGVRNVFDSTETRESTVGGQSTLIAERNKSLGRDVDFAAITYPMSIAGRLGSAQLSFQRILSFSGKRTIESVDVPRTLSANGGFDVVALGTGLRISQQVRVGATLNHWFNGYTQRLERLGQRRSQQTSTFDLSGWNANAGLIWSPSEALNVGLVGKTPFTADVTLSRTRTDFFPVPRTDRVDITTSALTSPSVRVDFPAAVGFGASWRPRSQLTLSVDFTRTFWSRGRIHNYFTLPPTLVGDDPPTTVAELSDEDRFAIRPYPLLADVRQEDTEQLRTGAEFVIIRGRIKLPARVGFFTDMQIFRASNNKAPRFRGFTIGAGLILGPVFVDAALLHEWGDYVQLQDNLRSTNEANINRILVSVIYRHGPNR